MSAKNIILLSGVTLATAPVANVVEQLESALALARSGNIRAIAIAGIYNDNCIHQSWHAEAGENPTRLIGAIARMQWSLIQQAETN
jgi:hypothetical protein